MTISCFRRLQLFRHGSVRDSFIESMRRVRDRYLLRWLAYVVMPEHVHLLVLPQVSAEAEPTPISDVLHDLKGYAGRFGKSALRDVWRRHGTLGTKALDGWAKATGAKPFWKPRGYDFNIVSEDKVWEKCEYIHANPVRRGLVARTEQWRWSSYRYYETGDDSLIAMDWDGGLPLIV